MNVAEREEVAERSRRLVESLRARGISRKCLESTVWLAGAGTVGSRIAELLIRIGLRTLWITDPDEVEEKDLVQGAFLRCDVARTKVHALQDFAARVASPTSVRPLTILCERLGPAVLEQGDLVIAALDRLQPRVDLFDQVDSARLPFLDAAVDGHDGRITEIAGDGACYHCHTGPADRDATDGTMALGTMAQAERTLRVERGCRAQADPARETLAAPYVISQVAATAVGRALHVLAGRGRVFEARLTWTSSGFPAWSEYELQPTRSCPTCQGRGRGTQRDGKAIRLPAAAGRDSLARIEELSRKRLGAGRLERPHPWGLIGEEPPSELWHHQPAEALGVPYGARLRFITDGAPRLIELTDDRSWLDVLASKGEER